MRGIESLLALLLFAGVAAAHQPIIPPLCKAEAPCCTAQLDAEKARVAREAVKAATEAEAQAEPAGDEDAKPEK